MDWIHYKDFEMKKFSTLAVVALSISSPALANCDIDIVRQTTTCTPAEIAKFLPYWKALIATFPKTGELMQAAEAIANADEARQLRQATNLQNLRQQQIVFETQISEQIADNQAKREAKAENRRSAFGIVAIFAGAGAERIAYGKNGGYNRSGGYVNFGSGQQYVNRTQPGRTCSNGTYQPVCPN